MLNSGVIDVAIGMIFVYLILSLITSAANEVIELRLKNRATDLERGIRELLEPELQAGEPSLVQQLYNHPLVNGLFTGTYETSGIREKLRPEAVIRNAKSTEGQMRRKLESMRRAFRSTALPSYIPSRNFALALIDLALHGELQPQEHPSLTSPPTLYPIENRNTEFSVSKLREALQFEESILPAKTRRGLMTLIESAGSDACKLRDSIEAWFNSSMDRVSGWYKRRSQKIVLVLGFIIAFAVNADSVLIAKRLVSDKALRDSLVASAGEYAKANASAPLTEASELTKTIKSRSGSSSTALTKETSIPTPIPRCYPIPTCEKDPQSAQCKLDKSYCDIEALGLPIGWNYQDDPQRRWPGLNFGTTDGWLAQIYWHFLGWLITALAISLGAPFWFDMLNKIVVVRSTVKPHEKSREEGSKG